MFIYIGIVYNNIQYTIYIYISIIYNNLQYTIYIYIYKYNI